MVKSNYLWILDAGHGGIDSEGNYTTDPKLNKKYEHPNFTIYEGDINRKIAKLVYLKLESLEIEWVLVYDDVLDTPLKKRVTIANSVYEKDKRAIYLSIHSNAGKGAGFEIFTSPGQTKSDKIAHIFCETYQKFFSKRPLRSDKADGDLDKEAKFYVLTETNCPALLVENLFFDNLIEAEYLRSEAGQQDIANCIVDSIVSCEKLKPI